MRGAFMEVVGNYEDKNGEQIGSEPIINNLTKLHPTELIAILDTLYNMDQDLLYYAKCVFTETNWLYSFMRYERD
jgi:hypothetical protein